MRTALALTTAALLTLPLAAQDHDPDDAVRGGALPAGWMARADRGSLANVNFRVMEPGWHFTVGPAAIYWRAEHQAQGNYTITVNMTQTSAPRHPEGYGVFVGGQNLQGDNQAYYYFLVRTDGQFLVKHRAGSETHTLSEGGWTASPAVNAADAQGRQTNVLTVTARDGNLQFRVNGQLVWSDNVGAAANGTYGLRVNHNLDLHVQELTMTR